MSAWGSTWGGSFGGSWDAATASAALASATIPHPEGYTFNDWASRVTEAFSSLGIASPTTEDRWQDWVSSMFYDSTLCALNIPSPQGFASWQPWATQFVEAVQ